MGSTPMHSTIVLGYRLNGKTADFESADILSYVSSNLTIPSIHVSINMIFIVFALT